MRRPRSRKTRSRVCLAPGFRVELRGLNAKPHNSPRLACAWYLMDDGGRQIVAFRGLPSRRGDSRNALVRRFPLPLPFLWSTSLTRVRAGKDKSPSRLPGVLPNLASIMALQAYFGPFSGVFFFGCQPARDCCMSRLEICPCARG